MRRTENAATILATIAYFFLTPCCSAVFADQSASIPSAFTKANAFDYYVLAASEIQDNDGVDSLGIGRSDEANNATLDANTKALKTLNEGLLLTYTSPTLQDDDFPTYYASFRSLSRLLAFDSYTRRSTNDYYGAPTADIDAIQLGIQTQSAKTFIASLVGFSVESVARKSAFELFAGLPSFQAEAAARRIELLDVRAPTLDSILAGEESFSSVASQPQFAQIAQTYVQYMNSLRSESSKPYKLRNTIDTPAPLNNLGINAENIKKFELKYADDRVQNELLMIELALTAYQDDHHGYPSSLDELVPHYLNVVPVDPFSVNAEYVYKLSGAEYKLYSVGPDGVDSSGKAINTGAAVNPNAVQVDSLGDIIPGVNP